LVTSIVVEDGAEAALPGEQRVAAEAEQVQVEGRVGLDLDGDGPGCVAFTVRNDVVTG
jgi:hypothetical protein